MAGLRQMLLVFLLAYSVECRPRSKDRNTERHERKHIFKNNLKHLYRNNLLLEDLLIQFELYNLPHEDTITFESLLRKEISGFEVIMGRIAVKRHPGFFDEFFPGFSLDKDWLNINKETDNDGDNHADKIDNQSSDVNHTVDDFNNQNGDNHDDADRNLNNDVTNNSNEINQSGNVTDQNHSNSVSNDNDNDKLNIDANQSNQNPFINGSILEDLILNADEDIEIDPRREEE